jgi:hypothetical protein
MRLIDRLAVLFLFSGYLATASEAKAAPPLVPKPNLNKKHKHTIHGVVTKTHFDRKTNKGTITVRIHHHQKVAGSKQSQVTHKTFHVNSATTFERTLIASKGQKKSEPATFKSIRPGEHVAIVPDGKKHQEAKSVNIVMHSHKGKAAGKAGQKPKKIIQ